MGRISYINGATGSLFDNLKSLKYILNVSKQGPSVSLLLPVLRLKLCLLAYNTHTPGKFTGGCLAFYQISHFHSNANHKYYERDLQNSCIEAAFILSDDEKVTSIIRKWYLIFIRSQVGQNRLCTKA
jgi:hypothetical protein